MAGDLDLGQRFVEMVSPMVWQVGEAEGFVPETRAMRTRVVSHIATKEKGREIKLGAGGLRDVEFTAQLLQLVHGRCRPCARWPLAVISPEVRPNVSRRHTDCNE